MGEAADDIYSVRRHTTTMLLSITHLYVVSIRASRARSSLYNRRDFHRHTQNRGIMNNSPSDVPYAC